MMKVEIARMSARLAKLYYTLLWLFPLCRAGTDGQQGQVWVLGTCCRVQPATAVPQNTRV